MAKGKNKNNKAEAEVTKADKKLDDHAREVELVRAELPEGIEPLSIDHLDLESTIKKVRELFASRGEPTNQTTMDMINATKEVIDLVEAGATWNDSPELRAAFKRVPNSYAKGPILITELQLLCGKIAQFDTEELKVWNIGSKVGNRWVLQDDMGFLRVTGRFPLSKEEAENQGNLKPDALVRHSYLSHCPHYDGLLFWASEPQHQITSPPAAKRLKKSVGGAISPVSQKETLEKRLKAYEKHLETADREELKKAIRGKIASITETIKKLETEAA